MNLPLLPTTLVGSYPRPDWLVDKTVLLASGPPRVRRREVWRVPESELEAAQDDAVRLAVADMGEHAAELVETPGQARRGRAEVGFDGLGGAVAGGVQGVPDAFAEPVLDRREPVRGIVFVGDRGAVGQRDRGELARRA